MVSVSSRRQSVAKTLSWRGIATIDTLVIAWLITGEAMVGASIAGFGMTTKMVLYYYHERAWDHHIGENNK